MKLTELTPSHAIKLASIAVHAEEFMAMITSPLKAQREAAEFDAAALRSLLADPQVREVLDDPGNAVLLPVKR